MHRVTSIWVLRRAKVLIYKIGVACSKKIQKIVKIKHMKFEKEKDDQNGTVKNKCNADSGCQKGPI